MALEFVKNQTEKLCLIAVKKDGYALRYAKNQTDEIYSASVKKNKEVPKKTLFKTSNKISKKQVKILKNRVKTRGGWHEGCNYWGYMKNGDSYIFSSDKKPKEIIKGVGPIRGADEVEVVFCMSTNFLKRMLTK